MVNISRKPVSSEVLDKLFYILFEVIGKKRSQNQFKGALSEFLSAKERILIAKRIAIYYLLEKNIETYNICDILKVTKATVNKYKQVKEKAPPTSAFNKLLKDETVLDIVETMLEIFRSPGTSGANWSAGWERRVERNKRKTYGL